MMDLIGSIVSVVLIREHEGRDDDIFVLTGTLKPKDSEFMLLDHGDDTPFPFPREWCNRMKRATPAQERVLGAPYFIAHVVRNFAADEDRSQAIPTDIRLPPDDASSI